MQDAACDVIVDCLPDGTVELLRSTRAPQELKQAHRLIAGQTALTISFKPPELPSSVFIVNHGVHGHVFELEPHKTVGDLQACCADAFGVPVDSQALLVGCVRVDDQAPHHATHPTRILHAPCTSPRTSPCTPPTHPPPTHPFPRQRTGRGGAHARAAASAPADPKRHRRADRPPRREARGPAVYWLLGRASSSPCRHAGVREDPHW